MSEPRISLEQWRALVAVVDEGGYAAAADALHKSQSTVSYAVGRIEDLLDLKAFEIRGRKAELTPAGRMLYRRGRALVDEAARLEHAAGLFAAGWEVELKVAAEIIFPAWLLLDCLETLGRERPEMRIQLHESVLAGTEELLAEGRVDLAVASRVPRGFAGDPLMSVRFIAAAAPDHPLHHLGRPVTFEDLRAHRHLVIRDTGVQSQRDAALEVTNRRWTVSNKATSIHAACKGLGFAWYAEELIRRELDEGTLAPLPLREGAVQLGELYLVYADPDAAGPGARRLGELLRAAVAGCESIRPAGIPEPPAVKGRT